MQKASFKLITDQIKEQVDNECSAAINIIKDQRNIDLVKVDSATRNYVKASKFTKKVLENVYDDIEMIEKVTKNLDCSIGAMESCLMELEDL